MSDTSVFAVGFGTFLLLLAGIILTALEMRKLYKPGTKQD